MYTTVLLQVLYCFLLPTFKYHRYYGSWRHHPHLTSQQFRKDFSPRPKLTANCADDKLLYLQEFLAFITRNRTLFRDSLVVVVDAGCTRSLPLMLPPRGNEVLLTLPISFHYISLVLSHMHFHADLRSRTTRAQRNSRATQLAHNVSRRVGE